MRKNDSVLVADFSVDDFPTIQMLPHPTQRAVMSVVAVKHDQIRPVGTCFAISNHGLVLTARHVVDEALGLVADSGEPSEKAWIGALYLSEPAPGDDVPDKLGALLIANKVHFNSAFDIAAMHLNLPVHVVRNEVLRVPAFRLSPGLPEIGSYCYGLGYHSMAWGKADIGVDAYDVMQSYSASRGIIQRTHFPFRDRRFLPFPCFEVAARFDKGMSGGPVFNTSGNVIGVICSSLGNPEERGYISYASLIGPSLFLEIEVRDPDDRVARKFLCDFVPGGWVHLDETAKGLKIERSSDALSIDFGREPVLNNRLEQTNRVNWPSGEETPALSR